MATVGDWMRDYNEKLARYNRLVAWEQTATPEQRQHWAKAAQQVTHDLQAAFERLAKVMTVTEEQMRSGFEVKEGE